MVSLLNLMVLSQSYGLLQGSKFRIELIEAFFAAVVDENSTNWRNLPMDYSRMKEILKVSIIFNLAMSYFGEDYVHLMVQEKLMAAGLPAVPVVMDTHYRETLGEVYSGLGSDKVVVERTDRGGGQPRGVGPRGGGPRGGRGRGGPGRGRQLSGAAGSAPVAGDQVGRTPGRPHMAVSSAGDKICLKYNSGDCKR